MFTVKTIEWKDDKVIMLYQRLLPAEGAYNTYDDYLSVAKAIENMTIRGAPAIGVAAAMGVALGALGISSKTFEDFYENIEANRMMGRNGAKLLKDGMTVLTHCNAGALCAAGFGTALVVIYTAGEEGKRIHVVVDETRPVLQGSRLTAWELQKHGIEVTLICDNMAGTLMQQKKVDCVIVGADRIAANGEVGNKIRTYPLAVLAKHHNIPFYVAAPLSTIDINVVNAIEIPIEERNPKEVTHIKDQAIAPSHIKVFNPAFDRTPNALVSTIITEKGLAQSPFENTLKSWKTV